MNADQNHTKISRPGYPRCEANLDALPGFLNPPPGYGEVPFWWWSGDDLDVDRLIWQVRELHKKGISGFQVNYSHYDTPGWPTDSGEPALLTDAWWKIYSRISKECAKLGMGIGLSTYTLDWPNGAKNVFYDLFYSKPELNAIELMAGERLRLAGGETASVPVEIDQFAARAYAVKDGVLQAGGIDLSGLVKDGHLGWTAPAGLWELWTFRAVRKSGSLNPLLPGAGKTVVRGFFQPFEDHNPGKTSEGLNFFFNDELEIGFGKFAWHDDFAGQFQQRRGYDLFEVLPAMWQDMGDITPKVRIDYAEVRMSLMEERYFKPVYDWHASRGIIFGCDNHGRGLDPHAYGDYFRACRWYSAPGHDTPGGSADPIKGKVSSSIANLYQRPRVWLEGYHSLGWGATLEQMMFATRENYLYGCTLFSLHGFYYTMLGSHWEWAPPCYHFRMPYWEHMGTFLKYFERLSYLMSQGHSVFDVAVIYPVTPYEAEMNGAAAKDTAFEVGNRLMAAGINFEFIDHESLARAEVVDGRLVVREAKTSYQALIVPNMEAVRWSTVEKAEAFAKAGGVVLVVGALPSATERAGRNDAQLVAKLAGIFKPDQRLSDAGEAVERIRQSIDLDVRGLEGTVRALHRKVGASDVYLVMDASPGEVVEFRARGRVELWDPWTGKNRALQVVKETATGTQVELPLEKYEAQVVVFLPGQEHENPSRQPTQFSVMKTLPHDGWQATFVPTMDNRCGDFRLPVTPMNEIIGLEARRFAWARECEVDPAVAMQPEVDETAWKSQLHGYGPQFYILGPIPESIAPAILDAKLAALEKVDPSAPVVVGDTSLKWRLYDFSWRYGKEGDPGHQGYHGLKGTISDDFIRLGKAEAVPHIGVVLGADEHNRYYLWSSVVLSEACEVAMHVSQPAPAVTNASPVNAPAAVFVDGVQIVELSGTLSLKEGRHSILLRYEDWGQSHLVLRRKDVPQPEQVTALAMRWYEDSGVLRFDPFAGDDSAEWFRFLSAPGTTAIRLEARSQEPIRAWINGLSMIDRGDGCFEAQTPMEHPAVVAVRLVPESRCRGASSIPEPIRVETNGRGFLRLGDWSAFGILHNYSGGIRYRTTFALTEQEASGRVELDLGRVIATAEATLNGKKIGVRVAPPWKFDLSGSLKAGENKLDVLVYNTLANHYQTSPSGYQGDPVSGLFGPVQLRSSDWDLDGTGAERDTFGRQKPDRYVRC